MKIGRAVVVTCAAALGAGPLGGWASSAAAQSSPGCFGQTATIVGTAAADSIEGTDGDDVIVGRGGVDAIDGRAGDDVICGGIGADQLSGGAGRDVLAGGADPDSLSGGGGDDRVLGGPAGASLSGGRGDDLLVGAADGAVAVYRNAAGPVVVGLLEGRARGEGADTLIRVTSVEGSAFGDRLFGDDGPNSLSGGAGDDRIAGNDGDDVVIGEQGNDHLIGSLGNDSFEASAVGGGVPAEGDDEIDGGPGTDGVSYFFTGGAVEADLREGRAVQTAASGDTFTDALTGVEDVIGASSAPNVLRGNAGSNHLTGGSARDVIEGRGGEDVLDGGLPSVDPSVVDRLAGDRGEDSFLGGNGNNRFDGGAGRDTGDYTLSAGPAVVDLAADSATVTTEVGLIRTWTDVLIDTENLRGSNYDDSFVGDDQRNRMVGNFGNDEIDAVDGISGNDVVNGAFDVDICRADAGDRVKACES